MEQNEGKVGMTAKRSIYLYYLDVRNDGKGVGPHNPGSINSWLEDGRISPDVPIRRIDHSTWTTLREIKRFANFLEKIATLPPRKYEKEHWENDPATEKQLKRLLFFDLPFPQTNLTKGEASRLIAFFAEVDPEREEQYQKQPADDEKRTKLRELVKKLPIGERSDYPVAANISKGEATDAIDEIETRLTELEDEKTELKAELKSKKEEDEVELMCIDNHYNDEDIREDFGYKKLAQKHLKLLREYLLVHDPDWSSKSRYDTAGVVLKLFPELKKAERAHSSPGRKHAPSSKGCVLILVPLIGILLYALKETLLHSG